MASMYKRFNQDTSFMCASVLRDVGLRYLCSFVWWSTNAITTKNVYKCATRRSYGCLRSFAHLGILCVCIGSRSCASSEISFSIDFVNSADAFIMTIIENLECKKHYKHVNICPWTDLPELWLVRILGVWSWACLYAKHGCMSIIDLHLL